MERKFITYFEEQGNDYTDDLIKAVKDKLESSGDIKRILIASSTGESALKLYAALDDDDIEIINVTHHMGFKEDNVADISDEMIKKLEDVGIKTYIGAHAFSGAARGVTNKYGGFSPLDVVADTLRMFSHGVKVSAEISIMAADAGLVPVGEKIIAIGGRGHGVDTAVILTPVNAKNLFDLKFHEIIAMPKD
ncbi:pyruvate kinase alpha/beta domain-containing protein [uncultured Methanobrevibacter sp.]|uniref:pyruvate kinase alpha/beta domain-containing protein n=1 Tax=uncultured Methanobrevibacter sp. TaxID=253161 RepID=UPI0025EBC1BF|nr:pyruvate kinase alpha/beta domain-containing protein [uncultured Methanobrevibacter sp.]